MKKRLLLGSMVVVAAAIVVALINPFQSSDHVAVYKPRSAKAHMNYGAQGAMEYQNEIKKNYFTGQVEYEDILETRRAMTKYSRKKGKDNDMEWRTLGPDNIGGRTRALWLNPENNNHLIGGAITGGLWQTFNSGNSWTPVESFNKHEDFYQAMMVASIERTGSGYYYIGTGSQHENLNVSGGGTVGFVGGGLFRSTNTEGTEWERLFGPDVLWNTSQQWLTVDAIVKDPNNPEKLWIGHSGGLDSYIHGNADLEPRPSGWPVGPCEDIQISEDGSVMVASVNRRGYISTDGGASFDAITGTLANGGNNIIGAGGNGRVEFAIAPSDPDYIYAAVVNTNNSLRGVIATFDGGANWYRIALDVNSSSGGQPVPFQPFGGVGGQGVWDCALGVNPINPKHIFLGGLVIYSWSTTSQTPVLAGWEQRSLYSTNYLNPFAVHPDIHYFVWDQNNVFYAATDGGFFKSNDMATSPSPTFYPANQGYVTTQFYGIAHGDDDRTIGGTQDNGTLYQNQMGATVNQGVEVFGGDGFDCEISSIRTNLLFGTSQFGNIFRSLGGGFGESISPPLVTSGDFTTNIRLVETENDPYSTRGSIWKVDTLYAAFEDDYQEWENGDITLGYMPEGFTVNYQSAADQRPLNQVLEENLYYYQRRILRDTVETSFLDTVDVIMNIDIIDSLVFPVDTTIVLDCDTMEYPVDTTYVVQCDTFNIPMDSTFIDTCTVFQEQIFCVDIDTIYDNYQDVQFCFNTDTNITYMDSVTCTPIDTVITYETEFIYDTTYTYVTEEVFEEIINRDTLFYVSDSLLLVDPIQSLFVVGHGMGVGIFVTRDALNTGIDPEYWNVSNTTQMVNCLEWSPDRNHLYIGTAGGQLIRISGFNQVYHEEDVEENLTTQILINSGAPISDIAVDYSEGTGGPDVDPASETVVVTRSTYGTTDKVLRSTVAASTSSTNSFSSIWNVPSPLDRMPVYSCVIAKSDPNTILVGTEAGIFRTTNGGGTWVEENGGNMDRVPVLDLRQQYKDPWNVQNSGVIYAGTHGRGIFDNGDYIDPNTSVPEGENEITNLPVLGGMTIFPNPMTSNGAVEFKLNKNSNVRITIFNINGQVVENIVRDNMPSGEQLVRFDANRLSSGTYILNLEAGEERQSGRFIVTK